jgi:hypothetical protein
VDVLSPGSATRRQLLSGGIGAGAVAGVWPLLSATRAAARGATDADSLERLIHVEQVVAFAYERVLRSGVLSAAVAPALALFSDQERQHVATLKTDLRRLGVRPPAPPSNTAAADRALAELHVGKRLTELRGQRDAIELLVGAEAAIIGAYYVAISKLADPALLQIAAQAMAAEGQHAMALRRVLHPRHADQFVPNAFVEGQH